MVSTPTKFSLSSTTMAKCRFAAWRWLNACDMLNDDSLGQSIPVIIVSGLEKKTDKIKAFKFGVIDYLVKPVDDTKLLEAITKAIEYKSEQF